MMLTLSIVGLALALLPTLMTIVNLPQFCTKRQSRETELFGHANTPAVPKVSILIPARNEESGIDLCIQHAVGSQGVELEIIILDDHSTDGTREKVSIWERNHSSVRLLLSKPLPDDWNGKQHACFQLSQEAKHPNLLFLDADVRLNTNGVSELIHYQTTNRLDLLSAFPKQETGTWLESWLIPMMHLILLGYLPFYRMRSSSDASYAAGCGQIFLTTKYSYKKSGGHESIRDSRHDGLLLPKAYRRAGLRTDVIDGTNLATCRMYHNTKEMIGGVLKNAHEGIARNSLIGPFTVLLLGGTALPLATLMLGLSKNNSIVVTLSILALITTHLQRIITAHQFRQSRIAVLFHLPAMFLFVSLQWCAFVMHHVGYKLAWRGRA